MTRTSESSARDRYQYTNDNPDPRFRPQVSALMQKLREMKAFDDPLACRMIIDDLMYTHLVRKPHPESLFYLLQQVHSYWGRMFFGATLEEHENEILKRAQNDFAEDAQMEKVSLQGEMAAYINKEVDLEDVDLKKRVRLVVAEHEYATVRIRDINVPACTCGKEFEFREQWANHVRSLIWKELKNV